MFISFKLIINHLTLYYTCIAVLQQSYHLVSERNASIYTHFNAACVLKKVLSLSRKNVIASAGDDTITHLCVCVYVYTDSFR